MTPTRVDWLRLVVWLVLGLLACLIMLLGGWLVEQAIIAFGPWVMAHSREIFVVVCVTGVVALWALARKDTPTW